MTSRPANDNAVIANVDAWPEPYAGLSQIELDARLYAELMEDPEQRRLEAIYEAQEAAAEAEYALRTGRRLTTRQG